MFRLLRPLFIKWLQERALVLPSAVRERIAKKLGLKQSTVDAVLAELREAIIARLLGGEL